MSGMDFRWSAVGSIDVAYAGMITRYTVELEAGGQLQVVEQNLETTSAEVRSEARPGNGSGVAAGAHGRGPGNSTRMKGVAL